MLSDCEVQGGAGRLVARWMTDGRTAAEQDGRRLEVGVGLDESAKVWLIALAHRFKQRRHELGVSLL